MDDKARIADLEAQVSRLTQTQAEANDLIARWKALAEWQPIMEGHIPTITDELYNMRWQRIMIVPMDYVPDDPSPRDFTSAGWTHFRPINAPPATGGKSE